MSMWLSILRAIFGINHQYISSLYLLSRVQVSSDAPYKDQGREPGVYDYSHFSTIGGSKPIEDCSASSELIG
jgi:hypothetical protein